MNPVFDKEFESLVEKFAELLVGDNSPDVAEKVKKWAVYNHIYKTMPALTNHWGQTHPEARAEVRKLFEFVRDRNSALKNKDQTDKE